MAQPLDLDRLDLLDAVETLSVPSYVIDRDGVVRWLNGAARELAGDAVGRHFSTVVAPRYVGRSRDQFHRKLHGVPATDFETELLDARGQYVLAEISSVAIREDDRIVGVFGLARPVRAPEAAPPIRSLTPRQGEVLHLLAAGASTEQIQETLHLSRETVRNHVRQVLRALGAHSRLEAVAVGRRNGLLDG